MDPRARMIREIEDEYHLHAPKVFGAMLKIPREKFIPESYRGKAYWDGPIPIGYGQTISQPYTVAYMTNLLGLKGSERVLEIGTGSGYQASVLSLLSGKVYSVEKVPELAQEATKKLATLGFKNVKVKTAGEEIGWEAEGPFDAIIVTAGGEIPNKLFSQLKHGGVLVAPVGTEKSQTLTKFIKLKSGKIIKEEHGQFQFVPLVT